MPGLVTLGHLQEVDRQLAAELQPKGLHPRFLAEQMRVDRWRVKG